MVPDCDRLEVLQTLWTYRDIESTGIEDMGPPTDLILHRTRIKEGTPIYKAKAKRLSPDKEWWLRKLVSDGMKSGMYERTTVANGKLSQWGADAVLVKKEGKVEPRLTFNYHYVFEEPPGNQMELSSRAHGFLSLPSHEVYSAFDLKNAYWATEIHPEDRHFLAFVVPGIGQVQPTRMAQGARSSSFTMNELGNIAFGEIPSPQPEISFLHSEDPEQPPHMTFYVDDIFPAHASWTNHWSFIKNHLLPRLSWARLKLSFSKIRIGSSKILALGEVHEAGGKITIKPERVQRILDWPEPGEQGTATDVRAFLGTAITARRWIKGYAEIVRPLSRLTGKVDWRWEEAERLAFQLIKNKAATAVALHGWDPALPCVAHIDASAFAGGLYVTQKQGDTVVPIMYDSFTFSKTERNYSTYKRELRAMVYFCTKHSHMFMGSKTSEVRTDHRPLTGFLNSDTHEDIYARWLEKLRPLNIKITYIPGRENVVADALSRTLFDEGCTATTLAKKLLGETERHDQAGDHEWFWKSGKGGFEDMLKTLSSEEIKHVVDEDIMEVNSGWVTFGEPWAGGEATEHPPAEVGAASTRPKRNQGKGNLQEPSRPTSEANGSLPVQSSSSSPRSPPRKRRKGKGRENSQPPLSESEDDFQPPPSESEDDFQPPPSESEDENINSLDEQEQDHPAVARGSLQDEGNDELSEEEPAEASDQPGQLSELELEAVSPTPGQDEMRAKWYEDLERYYCNQQVPEHWTKARHDKFKRLAKRFRWDARLGRLIHKVGQHWVQCVSPHEVAPLLHTTHDRQGHFSNRIILEKLRYRVYWPQMSKDVRNYINSCLPCVSWANAKRSQELSPMDALGPFAVLCMDSFGPFPETERGNTRVINMVDPFTRFSIPRAVKSLKDEHVLPAIEDAINTYAVPVAAYPDRGSEFTSKNFVDLLNRYGITLEYVPSGSHRAGGVVESSNRVLRRAIEKSLPLTEGNQEGDIRLNLANWDIKLPKIASAVNARHIEHLGYSPTELLFGLVPGEFLSREHLFPRPDRSETVRFIQSADFSDKMEGVSATSILQRLADLDISRNEAHQASEESKEKRKEKFDSRLRRQELKVGDIVFLQQSPQNLSKKSFAVRWKGPYRISELAGEHSTSFRIQSMEGKHFSGTYHGDQLKKYTPRECHLLTGREQRLPAPQNLRDRELVRARARKARSKLSTNDPARHAEDLARRRRRRREEMERDQERTERLQKKRQAKAEEEMRAVAAGVDPLKEVDLARFKRREKERARPVEVKKAKQARDEVTRLQRAAVEGSAVERAQRAGADKLKSGWTTAEEDIIVREVLKGTLNTQISSLLPLRTSQAIQRRIRVLKDAGRLPEARIHGKKPGGWSEDQEQELLDALDQLGKGPKHGKPVSAQDIETLRSQISGGRTAIAVKNRLQFIRERERKAENEND